MSENQLHGYVPEQVLQQRSEQSQKFLAAFDMKFQPGTNKLVGAGEKDRQRHQLVMEAWFNLYQVGWERVTIVNCLSWPLEMHTQYGYFQIPAPNKKKGEMFHTYTVAVPSMDMRDMGDGTYVPVPVMPVQIGMEFAKKYEKEGGVFWFKGTELPADIGERLGESHEKMFTWMQRQYAEGVSNWAQFGGNPRHISDRMRDAAKFLFERKAIPELPAWVTATAQESVHTGCPACAEPIRKEAKICRHCGFEIVAGFRASMSERFAGAKPQVSEEKNSEPREDFNMKVNEIQEPTSSDLEDLEAATDNKPNPKKRK